MFRLRAKTRATDTRPRAIDLDAEGAVEVLQDSPNNVFFTGDWAKVFEDLFALVHGTGRDVDAANLRVLTRKWWRTC